MYSDQPGWRLKNVEHAVTRIRKKVPPGEYCLTWWPGYAFMAGCRSVSGMENHMRNHALEEGATGPVLENYKLLSDEALMEALEKQIYPFLIDGVYRRKSPFMGKIENLIAEKYQLVEEVAGVKIYAIKK